MCRTGGTAIRSMRIKAFPEGASGPVLGRIRVTGPVARPARADPVGVMSARAHRGGPDLRLPSTGGPVGPG